MKAILRAFYFDFYFFCRGLMGFQSHIFPLPNHQNRSERLAEAKAGDQTSGSPAFKALHVYYTVL